MSYSTVDDVRAIVDTDVTDSEIVRLINRTDIRIQQTVNYGALNALSLEDLSATWTAYRVMLKDPNSRSLGEYSENRSKALEYLKSEIDDMISMAGGGIAFIPASEDLGD